MPAGAATSADQPAPLPPVEAVDLAESPASPKAAADSKPVPPKLPFGVALDLYAAGGLGGMALGLGAPGGATAPFLPPALPPLAGPPATPRNPADDLPAMRSTARTCLPRLTFTRRRSRHLLRPTQRLSIRRSRPLCLRLPLLSCRRGTQSRLTRCQLARKSLRPSPHLSFLRVTGESPLRQRQLHRSARVARRLSRTIWANRAALNAGPFA